LKKFLFLLLISVVALNGCKKDISTINDISPTDVAVISGQLKGAWVFPVGSLTVTDFAGNTLAPAQYVAAPALQFDGTSSVLVMTDQTTQTKGTYGLSTDNGSVFVNIVLPNGKTTSYQVVLLNGQTLKLLSNVSTTYNGVPAKDVTTTTLQKQSAIDLNGNQVRTTVYSESTFSATVYVSYSNPGSPRVTPPKAVDNVTNVANYYDFAFTADHGDYIIVDVLGDPNKTNIFAYYNGVPLSGTIIKLPNEIKTGSGWYLP
jgi:hypothetical protein